VTSTVIAVVTQTVNSNPQPDAAGGQARPSDWQDYIYSGPSEYDVCQSAAYPLNQTLSNGATPPEGSADYYTLVSAQAALRALNYGSPSLVVANGQFDGFLEQTIYGFQDRHKVPLTGVLDPATWSALNSSVHYWIGTCP
jgi:murein L,D-transpeptidase YcbB/YkuD